MNVLKDLNIVTINTLKKMPMIMRINYLYNTLIYTKDIEWNSLNELLFSNLDEYDYNLCNRINSLNDLLIEKEKILKAEKLYNYQPYRKIKCIKCGGFFYLTKKEVEYYKNKKYRFEPIPTNCNNCLKSNFKKIKKYTR